MAVAALIHCDQPVNQPGKHFEQMRRGIFDRLRNNSANMTLKTAHRSTRQAHARSNKRPKCGITD
jgi:hypothetical protein